MVLDESGYTDMWKTNKSADAAGRLDNLKELVRSMEDFENLAGFLEHISLVMDTDRRENEEAVNIMTLHSAKGLEFDTVFLPGWEEGLFPSQRTLDEQGRAGLEEERRLAHVGLTRARKRAKLYFATNRRIHGLWTTTVPSRFLDELPAESVEVKETQGGFGMSGYGPSRFDDMTFGSNYSTPGWQRAQARRGSGGFSETGAPRSGRGFGERRQIAYEPDEDAGTYDSGDRRDYGASSSPPPLRGRSTGAAGREGGIPKRRTPLTIEGELVAKSTGTVSAFSVGDRVFHQKFGNGNVTAVDGNKLTIHFDKAGEKRVVDSFIERV
jgi:DNA helicase-2/ATP-dependent DNA helicase PcrA